jgi:arylsulfate sulfotransferase
MRRLGLAFIVLVAGFASGCSSNSSNVTPETATVSPASADLLVGQTIQFTTNVSTNASKITWSVNGTAGGDSTVGTIDATGKYTAPATQVSAPAMVTATETSNPALTASAMVTVVGSGQVASTANPQVALYTIAPPVAATVSIQFGTDTTYGFTTWTQQATGNSASLGMLVAGMKGQTQYHMRAMLQMPDGTQLADMDHTFMTGGLTANKAPQITVTTPNGLTPQSGVEMLDLLNAGLTPPVTAVDLAGNVIWWYQPVGTPTDIVQPVKPLPNGHFLVEFSPSSTVPSDGNPLPAGTVDLVREIDLTGATIREISIDTLNSRLATAGMNYVASDIHHDVAVLPNGHWILLVNSTQQFTDLPGKQGVSTTVLGDALVDLDANLNPVWLWNTFDHLDVTRAPQGYPDWTHANAVLYSSTDGNLLLSIRHQSWIIKIDYANGAGAGDVLWHLGYQGDFTLEGGTAPTDWFSLQHGPSFSTQTTSGSFGLAVFDNGDTRVYPSGETCAESGSTTCPHSDVDVFTIDETAKTATLTFLDKLSNYSFYGGNAEVLANGNVEYDLCSVPTTPISTSVLEVTPNSPAETVWQMTVSNANAYRAFRLPSLYPGVQW